MAWVLKYSLTKKSTNLLQAAQCIQIDNLAISGEHSVIVAILNDAFLEDLNSTNGTYVNGQAIKKHVLKDNDIAQLGKYRLKFIKDTPDLTTSSTFEKAFISTADANKLGASPRAHTYMLGFGAENEYYLYRKYRELATRSGRACCGRFRRPDSG